MLSVDLNIRQGTFGMTAKWDLPQGARAAVIGPSGGGKSTLLHAIAGFVEDAGPVSWAGQEISHLPPAKRPVAILFQDNNLFPHLTVQQNLTLAFGKPSAEDRSRIGAVLARVGLADAAGRKPAELSGGQVGRAALARALLQDHALLLLDEPFAALGPSLKAEMLDLVSELQEDRTVLLVTHDPADARRFADVTILVADGIAQAPVATEQLFANPPQALRDYLG